MAGLGWPAGAGRLLLPWVLCCMPGLRAFSAPSAMLPACMQVLAALAGAAHWVQQRLPSSRGPAGSGGHAHYSGHQGHMHPHRPRQHAHRAAAAHAAAEPAGSAAATQLQQAAAAVRGLHATFPSAPADITWESLSSGAAAATEAALAGAEAGVVRVLPALMRGVPQVSRAAARSLAQLNAWALRAAAQQVRAWPWLLRRPPACCCVGVGLGSLIHRCCWGCPAQVRAVAEALAAAGPVQAGPTASGGGGGGGPGAAQDAGLRAGLFRALQLLLGRGG